MAEEEKVLQEPNYLEQALETNKSLKEELEATRQEMVKMAEDNKTIMKQLLEGGSYKEEEDKDTRSIEEVIQHMRKDNISDIDYAKDALAYRKKCMELKENPFDPFVGKGVKYEEYEKEHERADNLANCLQHCIDYSEGDNQVFINELSRITSDIPMGKALKNRR